MTHEYTKAAIQKIRALPTPRVLLNVCTHGSEQVGLRVADHFRNVPLLQGSLYVHIANKAATKKNKRFLDHDLNRVFPGKKKGSREEQLAYAMTPFIKEFDLVIDVHSTETGLRSTLITTKSSSHIRKLCRAIGPERVVHMKATRNNALISNAKVGIAFEYGKDKDERTYRETVRGIRRALAFYGMLRTRTPRTSHPQFYEAYDALKKPAGYVVNPAIRNYTLVRKGSIIARHEKTGKPLTARSSFYPILFGRNTYTHTFGFRGKKK